jgi:hypothetical protein
MDQGVAVGSRSLFARVRVGVLSALTFGVCVKCFHDTGNVFQHFALPQLSVYALHEFELAFYAWYALFGMLGIALAAQLLAAVDFERRVARACEGIWAEPRRFVAALALLVFGASLLFRRVVLEGQPIADDEGTYLFIARTLLSLRLTNPAPPDPDFFRNQFIILNDHGWYGKYPIGHPAWLALGEAIGLRDVMPALAGALCVPLTYAIGKRVFGGRRALLGAGLLLVSPHFVWTCATLLSQPTSCLLMLAATLALLIADERRRLRWALLAGAAYGCGVLVRPLPGALFAFAAGCCVLYRCVTLPRSERGRALLGVLGFAACVALGVLLQLTINRVQTGAWLTSGYSEVHGQTQLFQDQNAPEGDPGRIARSLFGALLRENFWLLGAACGLLLVAFARPRRYAGLFWGLIAAELAYRVIQPKTVVSTTGPVYVMEIVPLLLLAAGDGLVRLSRAFSALETRTTWHGPATLLSAGLIASAAMFLPVTLQAVRRSVDERQLIFRQLERVHAERALVFADAIVYPQSGYSWAYYPDYPSPRLDDDIVFVRVPQADSLRAIHAFWQRRFPDRRAFLFVWDARGEPLFREIRKDE